MPTVQIVTGILGSGKTSVLRHLLDAPLPEGEAAVVVGEFAEEGFDASMLRQTGVMVRQVTATGRGSDAKSYVDPVEQLVSAHVARIVLETSGVTEIEKVVRDLRHDERLKGKLDFGPTVVVLDAGAFEAHAEHFAPQLWGQVDVADIVIINKTDKANETSLEDVRQRVRDRNPEARVMFSYMGQVRRQDVLGPQEEGFTPKLLGDVVHEAPPADFDAFVYRNPKVVFDRVMVGHKMLNLPGRIARFKGVLRHWDRSYCVNGMPGQLDWDNTPVKGPTVIAFIGLGLKAVEPEIRRILDEEIDSQQDER